MFLLVGCKKEVATGTNIAPDDAEFCLFVENMDIASTGTLINIFLSNLENNKPDENLEKLKDWFESKSCVEEAEILCNSCFDTFPPVSELSINFIQAGESVNKIADISMSETLIFTSYH